MNNADFKQRFLFPDTDIRGELVRLDESLEAILGSHDYPLAVQGLVGEAVADPDAVRDNGELPHGPEISIYLFFAPGTDRDQC